MLCGSLSVFGNTSNRVLCSCIFVDWLVCSFIFVILCWTFVINNVVWLRLLAYQLLVLHLVVPTWCKTVRSNIRPTGTSIVKTSRSCKQIYLISSPQICLFAILFKKQKIQNVKAFNHVSCFIYDIV